MPIVTLTNIEKTFGQRVLFDQLNFIVDRGERVGLIGANGAGKTSLFKLLTRELIPDAGNVSIARSLRLGMLAQDPVFDPANTVLDEAELAFAQLHAQSHRLRELEHEMADLTGDALEKVLDQYQTVLHEFELAGGYAWRHRLEATLLGIGLDRPVWEQNVQTLSGGQRSRLALAKVLIGEADVLLLDEPTNHLDLAAIEWLENYLLQFNGVTILVSHDRYLLDRLATRIAWMRDGQLPSFDGNYSAFVVQRDLLELTQQRQYEEQQEDIEKQKEFIRRFGAGQRSKEAKGREKRLNRLLKSDAMISAVRNEKEIGLRITTDRRAGDQVLRVRALSKAYDQLRLWQEISLDLVRGERVGIIGPNGSGKTTLLEVLLGRREADAGAVKWGANLKIGYYDQRLDDMNPKNTVQEEVRGNRPVKDQELKNVLASLLFRGADIDKPVGLLSGGERARVALAQLLLDRPNVLVLDEPTNHLDIASREALENTLVGFEGTILCVSHDRYFLDKVVTRLLVLQPPGVVDFAGNYSEWVAKLRAGRAEAASARKAAASPPPKPPKAVKPPAPKAQNKADNPYLRPFGRLSAAELEAQIQKAEKDIAACQTAQAGAFKDAAHGKRLQAEYESLTAKLAALEAEYFTREK